MTPPSTNTNSDEWKVHVLKTDWKPKPNFAWPLSTKKLKGNNVESRLVFPIIIQAISVDVRNSILNCILFMLSEGML